VRLHDARVQQRQASNDAEAEPEAAPRTIQLLAALAALDEQIEQPRQQLRRNAYSVVDDRDFHISRRHRALHLNVSAALCVLGGIDEQIAEYLRQPRRVGDERQRALRECYLERVTALLDRPNGRVPASTTPCCFTSTRSEPSIS
jgi:hypothetical protein